MLELIQLLADKKKRRKLLFTIMLCLTLLLSLILFLIFASGDEKENIVILEYNSYSAPMYVTSPMNFEKEVHEVYDNSTYIQGTSDTCVQTDKTKIKRPSTESQETFEQYITIAVESYYKTGGLLPSVTFAQIIGECGHDPSQCLHGWNLYGVKAMPASVTDKQFYKTVTKNGKSYDLYKSPSTGQIIISTGTVDAGEHHNAWFVYVEDYRQCSDFRAAHMLDVFPNACSASSTPEQQLTVMQTSQLHYADGGMTYVNTMMSNISDFNLDWLDDQVKAGVKLEAILAEVRKGA